MTAPRLCDEDVHLASEESSRHEDIGQKSSLHEVKLTRARALLSEWGSIGISGDYVSLNLTVDQSSFSIMCYFFTSACYVCTCT